ncbi:MAG: hypothetical protein CBC52_000860 [Gammaproteobacteria bacterium TMED92]|nr:MAG: hypothetical protein CBC52_000860 [Gammaproteobacteria bacterium TMED92]
MADGDTTTVAEPSVFSLLTRDAMIVLAALTLWAASDAWFQVTGLWAAELLSAGDAIFVGYIVAAIFHEWGHYLGARISGARTTRSLPKNLTNLFRFSFDFKSNSSYQFHSMSFGGWIGHWSILLLIFLTLPLDTLGRVALVSSLFGFAIFATFIETGILRKTFAGVEPATALGELSKSHFRNAGAMGTISGVVLFTGLA